MQGHNNAGEQINRDTPTCRGLNYGPYIPDYIVKSHYRFFAAHNRKLFIIKQQAHVKKEPHEDKRIYDHYH